MMCARSLVRTALAATSPTARDLAETSARSIGKPAHPGLIDCEFRLPLGQPDRAGSADRNTTIESISGSLRVLVRRLSRARLRYRPTMLLRARLGRSRFLQRIA